MKALLIVLLSLFSGVALAQESRSGQPVVEELRWVDSGFLERQRQVIDAIGRAEFGTRIRGDIGDLRLLQRIVDENLINQTQKPELQAMGVVLGDVYVKELGLEWRVYRDEDGKSRAVCLPKTSHCLFPVTMISKRATLGAKPNIRALYERGVSLIEDHLPRTPYSAPPQTVNAR